MPVIAPPTLRESIHSTLPAPGKWANWWSTHLSPCWTGASPITPCESPPRKHWDTKNGKRLSTQYGGTEIGAHLIRKNLGQSCGLSGAGRFFHPLYRSASSA